MLTHDDTIKIIFQTLCKLCKLARDKFSQRIGIVPPFEEVPPILLFQGADSHYFSCKGSHRLVDGVKEMEMAITVLPEGKRGKCYYRA